jgi:glutaredoxin
MFGAEWCRDCRRATGVLNELGVDYKYVDLEEHVEAAKEASSFSGMTRIPVIVFPDGSWLSEPSNLELTAKVNLVAGSKSGVDPAL